MNTIYIDPSFSDEERRQRLYDGDLIVYLPRQTTVALCEFAKELIEEAFGDVDPREAQHDMKVEDYAALLGGLKPKFINHDKSKSLLQAVFMDMGCDPERTYFDVPRMRTATSGGYLETGIAYAWHPHRDTWYSAPPCQVNWWIPIYEIVSDNAMAFHPQYWTQAIPNDSSRYNYYQWNKEFRPKAEQFIKEDPRPLPRPTVPIELQPQTRLICRPGGVILFSGAQLHSTVPNTSGETRFSIDFRTVHLDDVLGRRGAPNIDAECTGTTMRDYLCVRDLSQIPDEIVALYDDGTGAEGELVYQPDKMPQGHN